MASTQLPEHHALIRGLYWLLVLLMLTFFGYMLVTGDLLDGEDYSTSEPYQYDLKDNNGDE